MPSAQVLVLTGKGDEMERGYRPAPLVVDAKLLAMKASTSMNSPEVRGPDGKEYGPAVGTNQRVAARRPYHSADEITARTSLIGRRREFLGASERVT